MSRLEEKRQPMDSTLKPRESEDAEEPESGCGEVLPWSWRAWRQALQTHGLRSWSQAPDEASSSNEVDVRVLICSEDQNARFGHDHSQ